MLQLLQVGRSLIETYISIWEFACEEIGPRMEPCLTHAAKEL